MKHMQLYAGLRSTEGRSAWLRVRLENAQHNF